MAFLHSLNTQEKRSQFATRVQAAHWITESESKVISDRIEIEGISWQKEFPWLSRDAGGKILQMVMDQPAGIALKNSINFAADGLFCEWAYVVDLDKETFEVFQGFNETPLAQSERFYGVKSEDCSNSYHPAKLVQCYSLFSLPSYEQFIADIKPQEEEDVI